MPELARASTARGEVVLRRRDDGAVELRVNGVFVMDTVETSSERLLARATLDALANRAGTAGASVLIGGLGLGFTLGEVLADPRVARVVVAEIEGDLVAWHRGGLVPLPDGSPTLLDDARVEVLVADVRHAVAAQPEGSLDVVLLDVDNGPGYLVYEANAGLYGEKFLATCRAAVRPGGIVAIWSAAESPQLMAVMRLVFEEVDDWRIPVILGSRATTYHLFVGRCGT